MNSNLEAAAGQNEITTTTTTTTTTTPAQTPAKGPDPFDLDAIRLDPAFEKTAGVRKVLSTVPVRKPHDQEWFRVHPDPTYRGNFSCIKLKDEGNITS
jgi:hypothetical protein